MLCLYVCLWRLCRYTYHTEQLNVVPRRGFMPGCVAHSIFRPDPSMGIIDHNDQAAHLRSDILQVLWSIHPDGGSARFPLALHVLLRLGAQLTTSPFKPDYVAPNIPASNSSMAAHRHPYCGLRDQMSWVREKAIQIHCSWPKEVIQIRPPRLL
jgi:hypothetical protein